MEAFANARIRYRGVLCCGMASTIVAALSAPTQFYLLVMFFCSPMAPLWCITKN